jgi:hypothetical protein
MIWVILIAVIAIIGVILIMFFISLQKDNEDLQTQSLDQKYFEIVKMINNAAFNGNGSVTILSKREFNLYKHGENQIIQFLYSTGKLTIIWKYKYFHKEVVHERTFGKVRNLSVFEQKALGENLLKEMDTVIERHKQDVLSGIQG